MVAKQWTVFRVISLLCVLMQQLTLFINKNFQECCLFDQLSIYINLHVF